MTLTGTRRDIGDGELLNPGVFGKLRGHWLCCTPNGHFGNLDGHTVTEHEDKTITVHPSILVSKSGGGSLWHGWLKRGVWTEC